MSIVISRKQRKWGTILKLNFTKGYMQTMINTVIHLFLPYSQKQDSKKTVTADWSDRQRWSFKGYTGNMINSCLRLSQKRSTASFNKDSSVDEENKVNEPERNFWKQGSKWCDKEVKAIKKLKDMLCSIWEMWSGGNNMIRYLAGWAVQDPECRLARISWTKKRLVQILESVFRIRPCPPKTTSWDPRSSLRYGRTRRNSQIGRM